VRKLLNTLFILSEDVYASLEGETVVVQRGEDKLGQFPLHTLETILCFSYKGASPALMGACAEGGINLSFLTPNGRFLARACGRDRGNVLLRREQYRIADSEVKSCLAARGFIFGKVYNSRWSLNRTIRDHPMRVNEEELRRSEKILADALPQILQTADLDTLRGIEGKTAKAYFDVFDELILNQKEQFNFTKRNRRPPLDRIDAALSFAYAILGSDCAAALESVGLDSYVGFMHRDRSGRASLSLDLMEELRSIYADRFVLTCVNNRQLKAQHFDLRENGAVMLNEEGRKLFLSEWQNHKKEVITHPYLKEKIPWGLVPYTQALLLARYIRGDLDGYPPFLWK